MSILVVGAGPTGLTAALELRRHGLDADIIERRTDASNLSRAVGILPSSMRALGPSGAAEAIRAEAVQVSAMIVHRGAREIARLPFEGGPDASILGLAQDRTEAHLRAALQRYGGQVQYGRAFQSLTQDGSGVEVTLSDGETRRYDHVIGADGVSSQVRQALGLSYDGISLDGAWSIADVEARNWPDRAATKLYWLPKGQIAIVVPMEAQRFRIVCSLPDALAALPVAMDVTRIHRQGTFHIDVRQVSQYRVGRVFLAGDAAHCHSPAGGRGMNLGISDAADLAERFARGTLEGYHQARHAAGREVLDLSERLRRTMMSGQPWVRPLVALGLRTVSAVPALRRKITGAMAPADS